MHPFTINATYRHSFVYRKADLDPAAVKALCNFIAAKNLEQRVFLKSRSASSINRFEAQLLPDDYKELTPVVVVEVYGNHWQSFRQLLQQFFDRFPFAQRANIPVGAGGILS